VLRQNPFNPLKCGHDLAESDYCPVLQDGAPPIAPANFYLAKPDE
jgi:hypothetical protein